MKRTLTNQEFYDLLDTQKPVQKTFVDHGRWSVTYRLIFEIDGKFWSVLWASPATEIQEVPDDDQEYTLVEVRPVEKTVTQYEPVED